jgi:hypothetical protein
MSFTLLFVLRYIESYLNNEISFIQNLTINQSSILSWLVYQYVVLKILNLLGLIMIYIFIAKFIKYVVTDVLKRNIFSHVCLSIFLFIILINFFKFFYSMTNVMMLFENLKVYYAWVFLRILMQIPPFIITFISLYMIKLNQKVTEESDQKRNYPILLIVSITFIAWLSFYVKTNYIFEDNLTIENNIENIQIQSEKEINGKNYILYSANNFYKDIDMKWEFMALDLEETNILGFKNYYNLSKTSNLNQVAVTRTCEKEACTIYAFGKNVQQYEEVYVTLDNDEVITISLGDDLWVIAIYELNDETIVIKSIEYR